ncbi:PQQ-binding-like beta-propeller repeat protein [Streptomyces ferrugineus]|uniref:PQQ-binding-like beta-propeller repeat protein n=1 Tax=Streptomyces ferrugineus TaxID=1413221 RepID=A0A7M2SLZ4_9ACTN|nr:serine/threonine-protein kinase [Streptomyces ferrugineus]QOV36473.1 PQQ-binding-like beta-propeller repeat protein [Streptomyces ferrugineus]
MAPQQNAGAGAEAELPEYAGHYRLQSRLGSGGMGVVHLARSTSGMQLAVKVVHAEFARDPEFRGRFRQEVGAARRVSGAFTAPVVDADPEAERPWMATLFIPGPTLSDHVKRNGPMDPAQLRRLMAGLAEALRDIHRVGVVHRDLKPSNVLLADDGPKVIDFGISRPKDSELHTETGKLIGTPPFMAPEQFRRPREVGPAADVFALGSVMVHAATGRGPFDSDSPYVVAYQVVHDEPDLTDVPANLAPLVQRCLAKDPEDRPTPDELMRELRSVAASYDTQAFIPAQRTRDAPKPEQSPSEPRPTPVRRRLLKRAALVTVALVLLVAGGVAVVRLSSDGSATHPKRKDGAPSASAGFTPWAVKPTDEGNALPRCSYGTRRLLCTQPGLVTALDPADGSVLWRHALAKGDSPGRPPTLSGGLAHVLTHAGRRLEALDPSSGEARWKLDVSAYRGFRYAGGKLLLMGADGRVTGVDSASGERKWVRRIPGMGEGYVVSFPGNPWVFVASTSADGARTRVTAVDPNAGDVRWSAHLDGAVTPVGATDGDVFFLSGGGDYGEAKAVVRYTPRSGATRRVALPVPVVQAQAGVYGGVVHLLGAGGSLVAVDTRAGKRLWSLETTVSQGSAPVSDGRRVYLTAADGRLLAVDAAKGEFVGQTPPRLSANAAEATTAVPAPGVGDGRVYATAPDGTVFAVDARDPSAW